MTATRRSPHITRPPARSRRSITRDLDPASLEISYHTVHGYRRAYLKAGRGPALLLIHGIGDSSESWRALIPRLAESHTVVVPDLLGHGRSDKPRADYSIAAYANGMRDLLSVLGIERATIVGHSLGGGVAAQFAYQFPDRCERLVLVGSGGVGREVSPLLRLASSPLADVALPALNLPGAGVAAELTTGLLRRIRHPLGHDSDEVRRVLGALPDGSARRAFVRTLRSAVDWRGQHVTMLDRCYLAAGMPTLLIWGSEDGNIPVSHAHLAHAAMPGSRLEVFEGAGHFPHHADPDRFVATIEQFLASTQPAHYRNREWRDMLRRGRPSGYVGVDTAKAAMGVDEPDRSGA